MLEGSEQARLLSADFAKQQQADANGEAYPVAPGIVVVPTPGLNSGARLVFVRMAGGKEFLFAGDLAQINQSWSELRLQPDSLLISESSKIAAQSARGC
jgi:glyoxylase-like metal-dependent hydrolase (beta-lactamase superfamily II)